MSQTQKMHVQPQFLDRCPWTFRPLSQVNPASLRKARPGGGGVGSWLQAQIPQLCCSYVGRLRQSPMCNTQHICPQNAPQCTPQSLNLGSIPVKTPGLFKGSRSFWSLELLPFPLVYCNQIFRLFGGCDPETLPYSSALPAASNMLLLLLNPVQLTVPA